MSLYNRQDIISASVKGQHIGPYGPEGGPLVFGRGWKVKLGYL